MRDAIGSTVMFKILIIFIVFYIVFMCFAVSYAKTFRLKNGVIDIIEQSQFQFGTVDSATNKLSGSDISPINDYLEKNAYSFFSQVNDHCKSVGGGTTASGACIVPMDDGNERYYQVYLYIVFKFSFFNWEIVMPVGGETTIIPVS